MKKTVAKRPSSEIDDGENSYHDGDSSTETTLEDVRRVVVDEFGERTWNVTEAALATHVSLLLDVGQNTGLVIAGPTGAGKTTVLRFFENGSNVYRSDHATPASFVSHDASLSKEELSKVDLLPKLQHQTLICRDMGTWFSGDREDIQEYMSILAHLMDGEGYTRDTGSHGSRGYSGDYRFNFLGASTPLKPRAWKVMGHTGNRFVFHQVSDSTDDAIDDVFGESNYRKKVRHVRSSVQAFLNEVWQTHGGYGSVEWTNVPEEDVKELFRYLVKVIKYSRAPVDNGNPVREGEHRVATTLRDIARGRALLDGRHHIMEKDVQVCTRIALSTMPAKRRPIVQALLSPENDGQLTASNLMSEVGVSRPTAGNRMKLLETLEIGRVDEVKNDERETKVLKLKSDFKWPETLDFPKL